MTRGRRKQVIAGAMAEEIRRVVAKISTRTTVIGKFEQGEALMQGSRDVGNLYKLCRKPLLGVRKFLQSSEMQGVNGDQKEWALGAEKRPPFANLSSAQRVRRFSGKEMCIGYKLEYRV